MLKKLISIHSHHPIILAFLAFVMIGASLSCNNAEKKAAAKEAALKKATEERLAADKVALVDTLKALRKIEAGLQVGMNYMKYGELIIEAKTAANEALLVVNDKDLKDRVNLVMECYKDAFDVWGEKVKDRYELDTLGEPGSSLISKYSMPTKKSETGSYNWIVTDEAMQLIWAKASKELNELSSISN